MTSKVEMANVALLTLGGNTINSFSDTSKEAKLAANFWDIVRRDLLRANLWNFAVARVELALNVDAPTFEYNYSYRLPADFIRLWEVYEDDGYKLEGTNILTNKSSCFIKYVYDNTETTTWDSSFCSAVSAELAKRMAFALPAQVSVVTTYERQAQAALIRAIRQDSVEDPQDRLGIAPARYVYGRFNRRG